MTARLRGELPARLEASELFAREKSLNLLAREKLLDIFTREDTLEGLRDVKYLAESDCLDATTSLGINVAQSIKQSA